MRRRHLTTLLTLMAIVATAAGSPASASASAALVCPNDSSLLPETYPASAITVSDTYGGYDFVQAFVDKALKAQPSPTPDFFLNVKDETIDKLKQFISLHHPEALPKLHLVRAVDIDDDGGDLETETYLNWQQDFVKGFFDPRTGAAVPRFVSHYPGLGSLGEKTADAMKAAGFTIGAKLTDTDARNGFSGGNFETVGGVCLLGDSDLTPKQWDAYSKAICPLEKVRLKVPTAALAAHHLDEIFKMIPTGANTCDFALMFASPREAIRLMKLDPTAKAFDTSARATQIPDRTRESLHGLRVFCGSYIERQARAAGLKRLYKEESHRTERGEVALEPRTSDYYFSELDQHGIACGNMTNAEAVATLAQDPVLREYNEMFQTQMDEFKAKLITALKRIRPECHPQAVDVPMILSGNLIVRSGRHEFAVGIENDGDTSGFSLLPNPTNGDAIGQTMIFPEPYNRTFKAALAKKMQALGVKSDFIDTIEMHSAIGDLHCSTQIFRSCSPAP